MKTSGPPPAGSGRSLALLSGSGVMGACGVAVGAAAAHQGGGDLARMSSYFLLFHAAAVAALAAFAAAVPRTSVAVVTCGTVLAFGTLVFSGDLAILGFTGQHLVHGMAPFGGMLMIIGWLGAAVAPWLRRSVAD